MSDRPDLLSPVPRVVPTAYADPETRTVSMTVTIDIAPMSGRTVESVSFARQIERFLSQKLGPLNAKVTLQAVRLQEREGDWSQTFSRPEIEAAP